MTNYGRNGPFLAGARLLEQYEIVRLLGTGGHAYVYECRDLFLDEHLAVKVIPNPPNRGRDLLNRARAEAQLLRRLSHPNVVRMHTAAEVGENMVCLVMEKLDGISLRHLLALLGRLSVVEAATIVRQIAIGVAAAHELNVVHRDIKPDNAFVLPPNNHVKVLDFGIAKFLGHGLQTSNKYRFQGTPLYMSPEHLKGAGVTVRSDIYQLGTVFFELLTGINPNLIDLDNPGFEQVAFVQITRPTPSLRRIIPNAPEALDSLIQKATAKEAEARFASMSDFVLALDETMRAFASSHPEEIHQVRVVDPALMQAALELAAREDSSAWNGNTETSPFAPRRTDSTMPLDIGTATTGRMSGLPPTDKVASFHPVPQLSGQGALSIPKLSPLRVALQSDPVRRRQSISLLFILAALGFGMAVGVLLLWLKPRSGAAASPHSAPGETSAAVSVGLFSTTAANLGANPVAMVPTAQPQTPAGVLPALSPLAVPAAVGRNAASRTVSSAPSQSPEPQTTPSAPAALPTPVPLVAGEAEPEPAPDPAPPNSANPRLLTGDISR